MSAPVHASHSDLRLAGALEWAAIVLSASLAAAHLAIVRPGSQPLWQTVLLVLVAAVQLSVVVLLARRPGRIAACVMAAVEATVLATWTAFGVVRGRPFVAATPSRLVVLVVVLAAIATAVALCCTATEDLLRRSAVDRSSVALPGAPWGIAIGLVAVALTVLAMLVPGVVHFSVPSGDLNDLSAGRSESAAGSPAGAAPSAQGGFVHDHGTSSASQVQSSVDVALTRTQHAALGRELAQARAAAERYPTVRDARAAGMVTTGSEPGSGVVFQVAPAAPRSVRSEESVDPSSPVAWVYMSEIADAPIVAVVYHSSSVATEGFTGPNDHWERSTTTSGWELHAWVVPGWDNPAGVFARENSELRCLPLPTVDDSTGCPAR